MLSLENIRAEIVEILEGHDFLIYAPISSKRIIGRKPDCLEETDLYFYIEIDFWWLFVIARIIRYERISKARIESKIIGRKFCIGKRHLIKSLEKFIMRINLELL